MQISRVTKPVATKKHIAYINMIVSSKVLILNEA